MKKLVLIALCLYSAVTFAQDEVTLVVSADGATKTQAIDKALRSAIEQTFGTFVSANTEILNDQLVKDEIATISSGNIQKYTELGSYTHPNGNTSVTLQATVSINKLVKYIQSKGAECEFAGTTLSANIKLLQLKYENSRKAYENLITYIRSVGSDVFDCELVLKEPIISGDGAQITGYINYIPNNNTESFYLYVATTLAGISLTPKEAELLRDSFKKSFINPLQFRNEIYDEYGFSDVSFLIPRLPQTPEFYDILVTSCLHRELMDNNGNKIRFIPLKFQYSHYINQRTYEPQWMTYESVALSMVRHMCDFYLSKKYKNVIELFKDAKNYSDQVYPASEYDVVYPELFNFYYGGGCLVAVNGEGVKYVVNKTKKKMTDCIKIGTYREIPITSLQIDISIPANQLETISKIVVIK